MVMMAGKSDMGQCSLIHLRCWGDWGQLGQFSKADRDLTETEDFLAVYEHLHSHLLF